jgi:hypothetical protein
MSSLSVDSVIARARAFRVSQAWAVFRLAREAQVPEATLRGMDDPSWNPTARTLRKLEAIIPSTFRAPRRRRPS